MSKARKILVDKLDKIFADYIKLRDNYICFTCGKQMRQKDIDCHCGHLFTRYYLSLRWNERSAYCQCSRCNRKHENNFDIYKNILIDRMGIDEYDYLLSNKNLIVNYTLEDLEKIITDYCIKTSVIRKFYNQ